MAMPPNTLCSRRPHATRLTVVLVIEASWIRGHRTYQACHDSGIMSRIQLLRILHPIILTTVQGLGRRGWSGSARRS